jgi:hypothetical protein
MTGRDAAEKAQLLRLSVLLGPPALIIGLAAISFLGARKLISPTGVVIGFVLLVPATVGLVLLVDWATSDAARELITTLHAGRAPRPRTGFSRQEALVAQGRLAEAATAYRNHLFEFPEDTAALVALARLLAGPLRDPVEAVAAYGHARRSPDGPAWDLVITEDLIDLYGRTQEEGRLLVELARFASLARGTPAGVAAEAKLRDLKGRAGQDG